MAPRTANPVLQPAPSMDRAAQATISVTSEVPAAATAVGVPVAAAGRVPAAVGVDRRRLKAWGFDGSVGSTFVVPAADGRLHVAGGVVTRARSTPRPFATRQPRSPGPLRDTTSSPSISTT